MRNDEDIESLRALMQTMTTVYTRGTRVLEETRIIQVGGIFWEVDEAKAREVYHTLNALLDRFTFSTQARQPVDLSVISAQLGEDLLARRLVAVGELLGFWKIVSKGGDIGISMARDSEKV